ncbi:MAG TPA: methyltransferase domain-containing protein [Chloroflexota bacterium]|nr:methyltransferase domain-containing protein [Chloroflexota bacterium]
MVRSTAEHEQHLPIVNVDQAAAWDGDDGIDWTEHEEQYNRTVARHTQRLFTAAGIGARDNVLDIGCGCGDTSRQAARIARQGSVLGIDLSTRMLERARERSDAEGLTNTRFTRGDVQVYPFDEQAFDLAISRFGVMFFADPVAAFRNVRRALKPGGRVAFLAWQALARNEWVRELFGILAAGRDLPRPQEGAPGPFGLADPDAVRRIFGEAGFDQIGLDDISDPVMVGADADDAFNFVRSLGITRGMLRDLDAETTARTLDNLRALIASRDTGHGVFLNSSAWLITARRT